ncbi:MAG: hypothetical protein ACON4J_08115 [Parvibaculales bacterium]
MSFAEIKKNITYFVGDDLEFIIAAGVVFILLVALLIFRAVKDGKSKKAARRAPPAILESEEVVVQKPPSGLAAVMTSLHAQEKGETDDSIALSIDDEVSVPASGHEAGVAPDESMDLDIPRIGETSPVASSDSGEELDDDQPKKKHGLFSFGGKNKDKTRDKTRDKTQNQDADASAPPAPITAPEAETQVETIMDEIAADVSAALDNGGLVEPADTSANMIEELQDLERQMKALRELHDAGLIATEIYLHKSRELAGKI